MKCEHCYHSKVCKGSGIEIVADECEHFRDAKKMVELPLALGDTVYRKSRFKSGILEATVQSITINRFGFSFRAVGNHVEFPFDDNDIGETVFLTQEAAQKALEEDMK